MGRKKKEEFADIEDRLDDAIGTYLLQGPGHLSLEQVAVLLWHTEGRKKKSPMTKMGVLKIEQNALAKVKIGLAKYGITKFDDVFDAKGRKTVTAGGWANNSVDD